MLSQHHDYHFPYSVSDIVLSARYPYHLPWQWTNKKDKTIVQQSLQQLDLINLQDHSIQCLSGGEQQRVAIASLFAQTPNFYFLDEPTNHLDLKYQAQVLGQLHTLAEAKSVLFSSHDINLINKHCDKVLLLFAEGKVLWGKTEDVLQQANLEALYQCQISQSTGEHWGAALR